MSEVLSVVPPISNDVTDHFSWTIRKIDKYYTTALADSNKRSSQAVI